MSLLSVTSLYIMFRNCTLHSLFRSLCHSPHFLHKNRTLTSNYSVYLYYHTFTDLTNESCSRRGGNDLLLVPRVHCGRWHSWWCTLYKDVARTRHKWPCRSIKWHFCRKQEKGRRRHGEICCRVFSTKQFSFCDAGDCRFKRCCQQFFSRSIRPRILCFTRLDSIDSSRRWHVHGGWGEVGYVYLVHIGDEHSRLGPLHDDGRSVLY
jgi:hypothetical protein